MNQLEEEVVFHHFRAFLLESESKILSTEETTTRHSSEDQIMTASLSHAVALAKKEIKEGGSRRRYSDQLKDAIRAAAKENSKLALSKGTGISYKTILNITGTKKRAKTRRKPGARRVGRPKRSAAVSVAITVDLPSGATLTYSDLTLLRADAQALNGAVKSLS